VHTVVAQKLKKSLEEISPSKAIKDLVGGKSTLQVIPLSTCLTLERNPWRFAKRIWIPPRGFRRERPHRRTCIHNPTLL
jgi:hypothetical protein